MREFALLHAIETVFLLTSLDPLADFVLVDGLLRDDDGLVEGVEVFADFVDRLLGGQPCGLEVDRRVN